MSIVLIQEINHKYNEYNHNPATIKFQCIFAWLLFTMYLFVNSQILDRLTQYWPGYSSKTQLIWRSPRKIGLTSKTTKARVVRYTIIQLPQSFPELTHSSFEASNLYYNFMYCIMIYAFSNECVVFDRKCAIPELYLRIKLVCQ